MLHVGTYCEQVFLTANKKQSEKFGHPLVQQDLVYRLRTEHTCAFGLLIQGEKTTSVVRLGRNLLCAPQT